MFFKRNKIEVVQPREYTQSDVLNYLGGRSVHENKSNTTVGNNLIPALMIAPSLITVDSLFVGLKSASAATTGEWSLQTVQPNVIPTGVVADASLTALATILDPIIDILIAVSFPIASIIVVCAFFLIMIGNKDKAFDMMLHAGLGYILIQLSPVFLEILKTVGDSF